MNEFIKNNINNINNFTKIKYFLYKNNSLFDLDKIKYLINYLSSKYNIEKNIKNNIEYRYNNKILKINNNQKMLNILNYLDILKLDDGILTLLENKIENIDNFEGLYNYNLICNNQIIIIDINNIVELEISTLNNINYQINIIIPNQNIYLDKIIDIINNIKNNI